MRFDAVPGNPSTPADEANVKIATSVTDVRLKSDLSDYTGQLQLVPTIRITDKLNGSVANDPATVVDVDFPVTVPCVTTISLKKLPRSSPSITCSSVRPWRIKRTTSSFR